MSRFGNRVPQFSFEICRPSQAETPGADLDPVRGVRGVAMLPGSGEYVLATTPVTMDFGFGSSDVANINTPSEQPDFVTSLEALTQELPECAATSLIVSWFGTDLRCAECRFTRAWSKGSSMPPTCRGRSPGSHARRRARCRGCRGPPGLWRHAGRSGGDRGHSGPAGGGAGGALLSLHPDGADAGQRPARSLQRCGDQAVLPWRGRITTSKAPGQPGSPDQTAAAEAEVAAFFGTAKASDFTVTPIAAQPVAEPGTGVLDLLSFGGEVKQSPVAYTARTNGPIAASSCIRRRFVPPWAASSPSASDRRCAP